MDALIQEIQYSLLDLIGSSVEALPGLVVAIAILIFTRFVARVVQRVTRSLAQKTLRSRSLQQLLVQTSYAGVWVIGVLVACVIAFPDLGLGDLIALLGLGSVAIGFAFQDIFKNFLAGILLLLQEPFRIGDQIIVEGYEGTVEEITLRYTLIRTYQAEEVVMPNSIVFTSPVQVLTNHPQRRTDLAIGVDYNTPLSKAVRVLLQAAQGVDGVLSDPTPEVDIVGFGDSSIDLVVRYWTPPEQQYVRRIRTQVMIALKQHCDEANINIPYPIRTLYFYNQQKFNDFEAIASSSDGH